MHLSRGLSLVGGSHPAKQHLLPVSTAAWASSPKRLPLHSFGGWLGGGGARGWSAIGHSSKIYPLADCLSHFCQFISSLHVHSHRLNSSLNNRFIYRMICLLKEIFLGNCRSMSLILFHGCQKASVSAFFWPPHTVASCL